MSEPDPDPRRPAGLRDALVPACLVLVFAATFSVPAPVGPLAAVLAAGALGAVLLLLTVSRREPPGGATAVALAVSLGAVVLLGVSALLAVNRHVSIAGLAGQHNGWMLWLVLWAWLAAVALGVSKRGSRWTVIVLASLGAVAAAAAFLDSADLLATVGRYSEEPAGFLESSVSLGQVLSVTTWAAVSWAFFARSRAESVAAWGAVLLGAGGLAVSRSLSSVLSCVVAGVFFVLLTRLPKSEREPRAAVRVSIAATAVLFVAVMAVSAAGPGTPAFEHVDGLLNDRPTIWHSTLLRAADHPWLGVGPDQTSAWFGWGVREDLAVTVQGSLDPHDVLLSWLVGGGILGLAAFLFAGGSIARAAWRRAPRGRPLPRAVAALHAAVAALALGLLFAWVNPLAAVAAVAILGVLLRRDAGADPVVGGRWTPVSRLVGVVVSGLCAALVVYAGFLSGGLGTEMLWARVFQSGGPIEPSEAIETVEGSLDPSHATDVALRLVLDPTFVPDTDAARAQAAEILRGVSEDAAWNIDVALAIAHVASLEDDWETIEDALDEGRRADPGSGMWDFLAAREARRLGMPDEAREYARRALDLQHPEEAEPVLRDILEASDG